ncbi:hypothetical protein XELAEV_18032443mg [Xenopus laevis]|uniref:Fucolectin tachylectin-4 pentraxin-1 domain-containing protein n=1 Tax=Xenopus laevis TaxID=8355 RepID=A0A974CPM1_XENLA|nr:hypothetical protein XELAEV_18032443mg [Xenopus laevis]
MNQYNCLGFLSKGNLARRGEATQSSYWYFMHAGLAIDGINHTDYNLNSCAHTEYEYKPWWRLDLKRRYKIGKVVIVNRMDCCSERLLGAEVRVGNSGDHNKNPICGKVTDVSEATITLCCNGMEGRYVSVVIPGKVQYLTLCEVEVYGYKPNNKKVNVARLGEATQSSDWVDRGARLAIDGFKNTNYSHGSCAQTEKNNPAWWRLDLKDQYKVVTVLIVNRMDEHSKRLLGAEIHLGNSTDNNNTVCGTITDVSKASITVSCKGILGRYITVVIPGREEYLTLCEVEVYVEQKVNLAKLGEATQSSDLDSQGAQLAIDGVKHTDNSQGSCSHTENDNPAWWRLDLKVRYKVETVVIRNRMDSHRERLLGAEIRVGDSVNNNNPICSTITNISQANITLCCNGMEGRYVSVVIPNRKEYLTLCEVEVFGDEYADEKGATVNDAEMTHLFIHPRAHNNNDNLTWWQLDLRKRYMVKSVIIASSESQSKSLMEFKIHVGDSADIISPVIFCFPNAPAASNNLALMAAIWSATKINLKKSSSEKELLTAKAKLLLSTLLGTGYSRQRTGYYVGVVVPRSLENLWLREVKIYGEKRHDYKGVNIARQGEAVQSSTYLSIYPAKLAIDGNIQTDFSIHPCTHTNNDNPAWWRLDLKARYEVEFVVIWNRMDEHSERLLGAEIRIGNSPDNTNPVCDRITDISQFTITLYCKGVEGRYVSVIIPWRQEQLTLCEVEVYGEKLSYHTGVNVARLGEAHQSSIGFSSDRAKVAIDGIKLTDEFIDSCTSLTNYENPAWWRLDLKKRYRVQTLVIVTRKDNDRLIGAEIRIGDSADNNNPMCGPIDKGTEAIIILSCDGMAGRYVSVVIPWRERHLQLCEVEVYGEESRNQKGINLARSGEVRQSSTTSPEYGAERAIDENKDTNNYLQPCTQTKKDSPAWWRLDLMRTYRIGAILIVSRGDRLIGAEIRVGDSLDDDNPICATITEIFQDATTVYCYGMEGRYVSVVISGDLSLCEVEVYGHQPYTGQ